MNVEEKEEKSPLAPKAAFTADPNGVDGGFSLCEAISTHSK